MTNRTISTIMEAALSAGRVFTIMDTKHKQDFLAWVERNNICVVDTLPGSNLRKGMMVMFTNDYGLTFGPHEVLGFTPEPGKYHECVYFAHDAYWKPCRPDQLTPVEKGANND